MAMEPNLPSGSKDQLTKSYINTYDAANPIIDNLVMNDIMDRSRHQCNGELVVLDTKERRSTNEIFERADKYAKGFLALGLQPGDDICVLGGCTAEIISLFVAAFSTGISYSHAYIYKPRKQCILDILIQIDPKLVVIGEGADGHIFDAFVDFFNPDKEEPVSTELPFVKYVFYDESFKNRQPIHKFIRPLQYLWRLGGVVTDDELQKAKKKVKPEHIMHHLLTSGSTGVPKCVAHTQGSLANYLNQVQFHAGSIMTMHHNVDELISYGMIGLLLSGKATKVILVHDLTESKDMGVVFAEIAQAIVEEKLDNMALAGGFNQGIIAYFSEHNLPVPQIKTVLHGAQLVSRNLKERNMKLFGAIPYTVYGLCETMPLAWTRMSLSDDDYEKRMEGRLHIMPNCEMRLVDNEGKIVDIGQDGSVELKPYTALKEYRKNPEKTQSLFTVDGFVKTGDLAVMYPDGSFVIKGRAEDAIRFKIFGDVVYPGPLEQAASSHPSIQDVSVISASYTDWMGDEMTFCIRLKHGCSEIPEEELIKFLGEDENKIPARVIYMEKLPTTNNSRKVSKLRLRDQVKKLIEADPMVGILTWYKNMMEKVEIKDSQ